MILECVRFASNPQSDAEVEEYATAAEALISLNIFKKFV
jgi:hypothetical protein